MKLFHGTTERHLHKILTVGLTPNSENLNSNWEHTHPAVSDRVYLTDAYALYFAHASIVDDSKETLAIVEVDTNYLDEYLFVADEDACEQASRGNDDLLGDWDLAKRQAYYINHAHEYSWEGSLKVLGTCAYMNTVPVEAISRIALISIRKYVDMVMGGYDPFISIMNYRLLGAAYRIASRWIFDAKAEEEVNENDPLSAIMRIKVPEQRDGIQVFTLAEAKERYGVA